jgi:putative ABC transport system ATP-binding protein
MQGSTKMIESDPIISFSNLSFAYHDQRWLFTDVTFPFRAGLFYLIRGPSGSGKSTMLRLINRLEEPQRGEIRFKGRPLHTYNPPELRKAIHYLQQSPTVVDASVRSNLELPFIFSHNRNLSRPDEKEIRRLMDEFLLQDVSLEDHAKTLSLGQLQRLCFIRGLLVSPEILLLDEPASALDEESAGIVELKAQRLCSESGLTVIMVSHKEFSPQGIDTVNLTISDGKIRSS